MKYRLAALTLLLLAVAALVDAQQAVIFVRHAEKADQSKDPALSEAGQARAKALAVLLARSGVNAIYATEYQRTVQTAQPLADALKLPVRAVAASDEAGLVERLRTQHAKDIVLVVGHSNTVPALLRRFGCSGVEPIADEDFGNVFVLVPMASGPPRLLRLRF